MVANIRLINRFVEIDNGHRLSVPRAAYMTHLARSPVQKNHSLNKDIKKLEDIHILNTNLAMMRNLQKVESKTRVSDLQSEWEKNK